MIGIYEDSFLDFLYEFLSKDRIKETNKNIVCPCPWCEGDLIKGHYHLYIALDAPIFHCFSCHKKGTISKLIKKLQGSDNSEKFVNIEKVKELSKNFEVTPKTHAKKFIIPELKNNESKEFYLKKRLRFSNIPLHNIKGLIFDIDEFIRINNIKVDPKLNNLLNYLQSNFIGFCSEHNSILVLRNIDERSKFKHYKLNLQQNILPDYYKIIGGNINSNNLIMAEGIFDILLEHTYDSTNLRNDARLYIAGFSKHYDSLLKSIVFYEQVFRPNIYILSDKDVSLYYYKKIKNENKHIIDNIYVYYNLNGKDFADIPSKVEKFII